MKVLYSFSKLFLLLVTMFVSTSIFAQSKSVEVVKVKSRTERSVSLVWPAYTGDVSQYILERSTDAKKFQELTVYVAGFGSDEPSFEFSDRFKSPYAGPLYYRLRIEGLDGSVVYTPPTILKAVENK